MVMMMLDITGEEPVEAAYAALEAPYSHVYMTFVFSPVEDALLMDFYGILMTFVPAE